MKIWDHCVIYTADDEEPDCMMCDHLCDHCRGSVLCKECGPKYGWHYYRREEQDSETSKLVRALEKLGLRE